MDSGWVRYWFDCFLFVCFFFFVLRSIFESALNWWLFLWKATEFGFVFLLFADLFSVVIVGFFLLRSDFVSTTPIDWVSLLAVDWLLFFALVACYFFFVFFFGFIVWNAVLLVDLLFHFVYQSLLRLVLIGPSLNCFYCSAHFRYRIGF